MNSSSLHQGIMLLGSSSAGKSTLASALQQQINRPITYICWDQVCFEVLQEQASSNQFHELVDYHYQDLYQELIEVRQLITEQELMRLTYIKLYEQTSKAVESGVFVVVNSLIENEPNSVEFLKKFQAFLLLKVLVYCNPLVLLEHLILRNSDKNQDEHRSAKIVFEHFFSLFKQAQGQESVIDVLAIQKLKELLQKLFLTSEQVFLETLLQIPLLQGTEVKIAPIFAYDVLVNSGSCSSQEMALQIKKLFFS